MRFVQDGEAYICVPSNSRRIPAVSVRYDTELEGSLYNSHNSLFHLKRRDKEYRDRENNLLHRCDAIHEAVRASLSHYVNNLLHIIGRKNPFCGRGRRVSPFQVQVQVSIAYLGPCLVVPLPHSSVFILQFIPDRAEFLYVW
jgi:hypothetical protein